MEGTTALTSPQGGGKSGRHFGNTLHSLRRRKMVADIVAFILIVILAAVVMFPIWWIFRSSLMISTDFMLSPPPFFPKDWLFSTYDLDPNAFDTLKYLANSMTIVVPCVVFGTLTALPCAYAFARLRFKGKKFIFSLCVGSMLLPTAVTIIPLYLVWTNVLGLGNTYWPLILPYLCGGGAFNIFLLRQFMRTIPKELDEAAAIDGAGYARTLTTIIIPAIKPAIIVVALLIFMTTWNDLLQQSLYISSDDKRTMILGLVKFAGSFRNKYAELFAATCYTFLPGVVVYLFGQRYFVEGIVMTGMKN